MLSMFMLKFRCCTILKGSVPVLAHFFSFVIVAQYTAVSFTIVAHTADSQQV